MLAGGVGLDYSPGAACGAAVGALKVPIEGGLLMHRPRRCRVRKLSDCIGDPEPSCRTSAVTIRGAVRDASRRPSVQRTLPLPTILPMELAYNIENGAVVGWLFSTKPGRRTSPLVATTDEGDCSAGMPR